MEELGRHHHDERDDEQPKRRDDKRPDDNCGDAESISQLADIGLPEKESIAYDIDCKKEGSEEYQENPEGKVQPVISDAKAIDKRTEPEKRYPRKNGIDKCYECYCDTGYYQYPQHNV